MRKVGLIFGLVIAFGCVPEGKIYDPEAAPNPAKEKRQPPASPQRPAGTADPAHVYYSVMFIRRNAERHRRAIDACGVAFDCTYFQPQDLRAGEVRLNLPKYAKRCLEEWIPQCEEALDELEMHPPPSTLPQSVRTNYMKYAHEAPSIQLRIQKLELRMLRDYGRPLKMKKDDEGYQDFWSVWVPELTQLQNCAERLICLLSPT
jgi:hypothetical protein